MYSISPAALALLQATSPVQVTILVDGVSGSLTLTDEDIALGSLVLDRSSVEGKSIEIGAATAALLKFELDNHDRRFDGFTFEGADLEVILAVGVDTIPLGRFIVDQPPKRLSTLQIVALDYMAKFKRPYGGALSYPATLAQILQDVCTQCGITLATTTFLNQSYSITERPADVTCHEIVAAVAELAGCCAWIDWDGELRLSWYGSSSTCSIGPSDRFSGYQMAESDITITGIRYEDQDYQAGTTDYSLVIEGNPLLQGDWQAVVDAIYATIGGFTYRPWSADCKAYPHLWPLDVVNPLTDSEGVSRIGIITNHKYNLGGLSSLAGVGETETVKGYATAAPFTARQRTVIQRTAEIEASAQVTPVQQMALKLNALAAGAVALNTTEYGGITYWHDASTLIGSTYISCFTDAGFMWTNDWNGGAPVWNYGFTADGDALFRYLSVKGLNADWITLGGRISSVSGDVYLDLDADALHLESTIGGKAVTIDLNTTVGLEVKVNAVKTLGLATGGRSFVQSITNLADDSYYAEIGRVGSSPSWTYGIGFYNPAGLGFLLNSTAGTNFSIIDGNEYVRYSYDASGNTTIFNHNGMPTLATNLTRSYSYGRMLAVGRSTSWGDTAGDLTGAFNAVMGTAGLATWMWSASSGGTFRYGFQGLDAGGNLRLYVGTNYYQFTGTEMYVGTNKVWHQGNDGASSTLDADLLDGLQGTEHLPRVSRLHSSDGTTADGYLSNSYQTFNYSTGGSGFMGPLISFGGLSGGYPMQITGAYSGGNTIKVRTGNSDGGSLVWNAWRTLWHDGNFSPSSYLPLSGGTLSGTLYGTLLGTSGSPFSWLYVNNLVVYSTATTHSIIPEANGSYTLGNSSYRWSSVWCSTGTFNSDYRLKHDVGPIDRGIDFILNLDPVQFKFNDGESGRVHYGFIAQDVKKAASAAGIDDCAVYVDPEVKPDWDTTDEALNGQEHYWALRYTEIIAPLVQTVQHLNRRINELETQLRTQQKATEEPT